MATDQQMIHSGGRLIGTVLKAPDQNGKPLLEAHAMDQSILFSGEKGDLMGIVQSRSLQFLQQGLMMLALPLEPFTILAGSLESALLIAPLLPGATHHNQRFLKGDGTQLVEPLALQSRSS